MRARTFVGRSGFNRIVANSEMNLPGAARSASFLNSSILNCVQAYSPLGHEIVGAIADDDWRTLHGHKDLALLDGLTLEEAAS